MYVCMYVLNLSVYLSMYECMCECMYVYVCMYENLKCVWMADFHSDGGLLGHLHIPNRQEETREELVVVWVRVRVKG